MKYKKFPSLYELYYNKWNGIDFDKEKLIKLIRRIKLLKFTSIFYNQHKEELELLNKIYQSYDEKTLIKLLNNDEIVSRNAYIEKWARIGAIDILLNNIYSRQTYTSIINLPREDYQLTIKRIEELIKVAQSLTHQSDKISNDIPGNE